MLSISKFFKKLLAIPICLLAGGLYASESLPLVPQEINDKLLRMLSGNDEAIPEGQIRFIGNFNQEGFSISSVKNITVKTESCSRIGLKVETSSIIREFDEIVSLWFSFDVPASEISGGKTLSIEWGSDIDADNLSFENIRLNPKFQNSYKTFSWRKKGDSASFATIEVIADSHADYYFLWYLLPMALIFAALAVRKISCRNVGDRNP